MDHSAVAGWESPAAVPGPLRASAGQDKSDSRALSALHSEVWNPFSHDFDGKSGAAPAEDAVSSSRGLSRKWSMPRTTTGASGSSYKT